MSDANQVRINELARDLEVKAKAIIDVLSGFGVTEKKTHSSSIPADVAEKVRKHFLSLADAEAAAEAAAKAEKEKKDAAAKAARQKAAAPAAASKVAAKPAVSAAKPAAPPTAPASAPIPLAPSAGIKPAATPAPPAAATRIPQAPATPGRQPAALRPAAPLPTGNRPPITAPPSGPRPGTPIGQRSGGPRRGEPIGQRAPLQGAGATPGRPLSSRPGAPSAPSARPYSSRPGAQTTGTRPGPRMPGRPGMLPPMPERFPSKAEPGKPLYTRKPPPRRRPILDKREAEGERKLHPVRSRVSGDRRGAVAVPVAPPEPRPPREVTLTEGITIRELAEKLDEI